MRRMRRNETKPKPNYPPALCTESTTRTCDVHGNGTGTGRNESAKSPRQTTKGKHQLPTSHLNKEEGKRQAEPEVSGEEDMTQPLDGSLFSVRSRSTSNGCLCQSRGMLVQNLKHELFEAGGRPGAKAGPTKEP
jgi:hypothetical protein